MSARRQARAGLAPDTVAADAGGVPRALLIGRCIEVWATDPARAPLSAFARFSQVRRWWLAEAGIDGPEAGRLVPQGPPWSIEYLTDNGHEDQVRERLRRAGVTMRSIPKMRREAAELHAQATEHRYTGQ